jgi:hypothetical protein
LASFCCSILVAACPNYGTAEPPSQSTPHYRITTWHHILSPIGSDVRPVPGTTFTADVYQEFANTIGTKRYSADFGVIRSDKDGIWYAVDARVPAIWDLRWLPPPCQGKSDRELLQHAQWYDFVCTYERQIMRSYGLLANGEIVYTGGSDKLLVDEVLNADESRTSPDGRFTLVQQGDGNLVLYNNQTGSPLWSSGTCCWSYPTSTRMQADGNLVVTSWAPMWSSGTAGNSGAELVVQSDGNVVIYAEDGTPLWSTQTGGQ